MKYSIHILENEKKLLENCLSEWDLKHYPEARKKRSDKLKDLNISINKLKK